MVSRKDAETQRKVRERSNVAAVGMRAIVQKSNFYIFCFPLRLCVFAGNFFGRLHSTMVTGNTDSNS